MNKEIKEIYLSNLEWSKTHDNMGGVIGNLIFKDNMPYEEYEKLLKSGYFVLCNKDYITNLQQENEDYKSRVERAVEYINKTVFNEKGYITFCYELENILQNGSDENE